MAWFNDLKLRAKLLLGFGLILASLVAVLTIGYVGMAAITESQRALYQVQFANAVDLKDVRSNQNAIGANITAMLLRDQRSDPASLVQDIATRSRENTETMKKLIERNKNDSRLSRKIEDFGAIRAEYRRTREAQIIPLINEGKLEEAKALFFGAQAERRNKMRQLADELVAEADERAQAALTQSERITRDALVTFAVAGLIALVVGGIMAAFLSRVIGRVSQEVREGATVLASSASEIVATTTQVASGAAETAAAVNETTTTVEEVKK
ncbi:MAG: MCP four helix bundle domain-containing protein, partial [Betaproteobacteria bacterium]|nr:MCP four helix bundle domain-containing protein [Betaproteobacteria bacterium]